MQGSKIAVLALLFSSLALANINKDFAHILDGTSAVTLDDIEVMYSKFVQQYKQQMNYSPSSQFKSQTIDRKMIFAQKVQEIIKHNTAPSVSYKKGLNPFSDMTEEEFVSYYNINAQAEQNCSATKRSEIPQLMGDGIPEQWDWRDKGIVSPVKNQGHCGSCWTFSTVGCLEAHYLKRYGQFKNLSEQQLVDCASAYDNHGCNGGLPSHAFEYVKDNGGISTEASYPYQAVTNQCTVNPSSYAVGVRGGAVNISLSEEDLRQALFNNGPISIAFQVVDGFRDYSSGVYVSSTCKNGPSDVNHAVLAVGYGTENGVNYWLIKNSWGAAWGDKGFFKMQRGVNMCGVAVCNSYPQEVYDISQEFKVFLQ
ncbi:cathepsin h [Stylonychia lemnae]|uniref:Cathepsin h n=1 Tax=Stylonychia lemnae TaxID=5949 RepID=A0A078AGK0_STYLE|nr:cathepsin h [Stylonychia lemnae]|eukprot:CDW81400.1 cathepsin h [Stylonychia lemnae]